MIDLSTEDVFPVSEAPKHIPGRPSQASCWRWVLHGVGGIKLESILIGGKRFVSAEAVQRFCDRRTALADGDTRPVRTSRQQERAMQQAERDFDANV
ncbi:hypothetical protein Mal52_58990 [Symmachiella dynata]|uniref:DUF1580 domain-containing protein n=1 Tax=Symmachiella dynata TaxID=2527995 RepID=A0A517ZY15_9PLAN|nr:DUF1580 domain-containing protein [Symmachiella dynata]QDU47370.1 hypothetical protein Mal52_58990 [Symmachiella dynata]